MGPCQYPVSFIACLSVYELTLLYSPRNREELFNLRHAMARNPIERIFGIVKRRFPILVRPPEYSMDIQARIPCALAAVDNVIRLHDPFEIHDFEETITDPSPGECNGTLVERPPTDEEKEEAESFRDIIAQAMWEDYQEQLAQGNQEVFFEE